mgnify:CR=1 FL=1
MNLYNEIMYHKEVDHNAAHSKWGNQFLHLVSSLMMIGAVYCFFYETIELCSKIAIVSHSGFIGRYKDKYIRYIENGDTELKHCFPYEIEFKYD